MTARSTAASRWGAPVAVIWAGVMLSAWVRTEKVTAPEAISSWKMGLLFLGVPALQVLVLIALRRLVDRGAQGRGSDLLLVWLMTFLFGLHAALLAVAIGLIPSLARALPWAVGFLMIGIGPVVGGLEHGSVLGLRTRVTLKDPGAWRRVHRFAAASYLLAGLSAPLGLLLKGPESVYVALCPSLFAVVCALGYAGVVRSGPPNEHSAASERLANDEDSDGASL